MGVTSSIKLVANPTLFSRNFKTISIKTNSIKSVHEYYLLSHNNLIVIVYKNQVSIKMTNLNCFLQTLFACVGFLIALCGNTNVGANTIPNESSKLSKNEDIKLSVAEFARSTHDFSQDFMRQVWDADQNFVFSPLSIHITLAMLASSA